MAGALKIVLVVFAVGLGVLGWQLIDHGPAALTAIGHTPEALPQVLGGRFIGMAALVLVLALLSEWRAVAVTLASGALMGVIDRFVEPAEFAYSHLGFAAVCTTLAVVALVVARRA